MPLSSSSTGSPPPVYTPHCTSRYFNCYECTLDPLCGWCSSSSGAGSCADGFAAGPFPYPGVPQCSSLYWKFSESTCSSTPEADLFDPPYDSTTGNQFSLFVLIVLVLAGLPFGFWLYRRRYPVHKYLTAPGEPTAPVYTAQQCFFVLVLSGISFLLTFVSFCIARWSTVRVFITYGPGMPPIRFEDQYGPFSYSTLSGESSYTYNDCTFSQGGAATRCHTRVFGAVLTLLPGIGAMALLITAMYSIFKALRNRSIIHAFITKVLDSAAFLQCASFMAWGIGYQAVLTSVLSHVDITDPWMYSTTNAQSNNLAESTLDVSWILVILSFFLTVFVTVYIRQFVQLPPAELSELVSKYQHADFLKSASEPEDRHAFMAAHSKFDGDDEDQLDSKSGAVPGGVPTGVGERDGFGGGANLAELPFKAPAGAPPPLPPKTKKTNVAWKHEVRRALRCGRNLNASAPLNVNNDSVDFLCSENCP